MDGAHEKAQETRKKNEQQRREMARQAAAEREADRKAVIEACRGVLEDQRATPEQRIWAVSVLDNVQGHRFVPYSLKFPETPQGAKADQGKEE